MSTTTAELGGDLLRASARLTRWASRHATFDLPMAQARLLALVDELGPARVSTLAQADHSSQPSMTTQLQRAEAAGWVHRTPDPDDARASLLALTASGRAALDAARAARLAAFAPVLAQLDSPSMERVRTAVDVLNEVLALAAQTPIIDTHRKDS